MSKSDNIRVHITMTPKQYARMKKHSQDSGYSISELMRRAIDLYLVKTDAKKNG